MLPEPAPLLRPLPLPEPPGPVLLLPPLPLLEPQELEQAPVLHRLLPPHRPRHRAEPRQQY